MRSFCSWIPQEKLFDMKKKLRTPIENIKNRHLIHPVLFTSMKYFIAFVSVYFYFKILNKIATPPLPSYKEISLDGDNVQLTL